MKLLRNVVVDTSSLINDNKLIDKLVEEYRVILPITVLEELDNLKQNSLSDELKFNARNAIKSIKSKQDDIEFDLTTSVDEIFSELTNDNKIITSAKRNNAFIISDDLNLKVKGNALGVESIDFKKEEDNECYFGYKVIRMTEKELLEFYELSKENLYECNLNEYIIIIDENDNVLDKLKWNGERYIPISFKNINNDFIGRVKPKNAEQELAFDMLQDSDISVKILTGCFGAGKDFLMASHAIDLIRKSKFEKIIWIRNNIEVKNSKSIGFLPGSREEKLLPFAAPLADNIGGFDGLELLMHQGKLEIEHFGFIRGRSFNNCIVICSEAENTTKEHLQLLVSRMGDSSQLWINGDYKQIDEKIFEKNNGLRQMIKCLKGNKLFATVKLNTTERSETAKLAELLG